MVNSVGWNCKSDRLYLCKDINAINQMQEKNHNYQQRLQ
jgi:hypothetical protein